MACNFGQSYGFSFNSITPSDFYEFKGLEDDELKDKLIFRITETEESEEEHDDSENVHFDGNPDIIPSLFRNSKYHFHLYFAKILTTFELVAANPLYIRFLNLRN